MKNKRFQEAQAEVYPDGTLPVSMKDFEPAKLAFSLSGDGNHLAIFINKYTDYSYTTLEPTYLKVFELCMTPSAAFLLPMKFVTVGITLMMSTLLFV